MAYKNQRVFIKVGDEVGIYSVENPARPQLNWRLGEVREPKQLTFHGNYALVANYTDLLIYDCSEILSVESDLKTTPSEFDFHAYPNPFNNQTRITFQVTTKSDVSLAVYDLTGRLVNNPSVQSFMPGVHSLIWDASGLSSGVYICCLNIGDSHASKKVALIR